LGDGSITRKHCVIFKISTKTQAVNQKTIDYTFMYVLFVATRWKCNLQNELFVWKWFCWISK